MKEYCLRPTDKNEIKCPLFKGTVTIEVCKRCKRYIEQLPPVVPPKKGK